MNIKYLIYKNITEDYEIDTRNFFPNLTLLVGVSGAGKTQILQALYDVCQFAVGRGEKIHSAFEAILGIGEGKDAVYEWKIETSVLVENTVNNSVNLSVDAEALTKQDGTVVFSRTKETVSLLNYSQVPMPKQTESLISQYRNLDVIAEVFSFLENVCLADVEGDMQFALPENFWNSSVTGEKLDAGVAQGLSESTHMSPIHRLGAKKFAGEVAYEILRKSTLEIYQDIFPMVEDLDYRQNDTGRWGVAIKTNGHWVFQKQISTGMLKTLWHILDMKTLPKGAVVLVDEFENGLGVNCIDVVSSLVMEERMDIQMILTSHHPYIINKIPMECWKITKREHQKVYLLDAADYNLGKSKHEAYIALMNKLQNEERNK